MQCICNARHWSNIAGADPWFSKGGGANIMRARNPKSLTAQLTHKGPGSSKVLDALSYKCIWALLWSILIQKQDSSGSKFRGGGGIAVCTPVWIRHCTIISTLNFWTLIPIINTLFKSDVTRRDHVVRCREFQECGSRFVNFIRDGTVFA